MPIYTPYTYLVGWSELRLYYYGVRYAKGCHPDDFWQTYFTSSKYVSENRENYGEPDVRQIRKTFKTAEDAIAWENKVIRRMALHQNEEFLNKCAYPAMSPDIMSKRKVWNKGKKTGPLSEEHRKKLSSVRKGKKKPEGFLKGNQNTKGMICITNGKENRLISKDVELPIGFKYGRTYKSTKNMGRPKGKTMSEEAKAKMSKSRTGFIWINNEVSERKIRKSEEIPRGWKRGRKPKITSHPPQMG